MAPSDWAAYYSWRGQPPPDRPPWLSSPSGKWGSGVGAGSPRPKCEPRPKSEPRPRSPGRADGAVWTDRQQQRRVEALRACASPDAQECSFPQAGWVTGEARQLEREFTAGSPAKAAAPVPAKVAAAATAAAARVAAAAAAAAAKAVTSPAKAAAAVRATRGSPLPSEVADGVTPELLLSHELEALRGDTVRARHAEIKVRSARKVQALRTAAEAEEARQLEREISLSRNPQQRVAVRSLPAKVANGLALVSHELEALREAARIARISRVHGPNRLFLEDLL